MSERLGYFAEDTNSNTWGLPHIQDREQLKTLDAWLYTKDNVLYLDQNLQPDLPPLCLVFDSGRTAHRLKQVKHHKLPLAKACGLSKGRRPEIIDATSGFAQDSLLLAAMGSKVTMLEQHPLIFALAADALLRASQAKLNWLASILTNIEHYHIDAVTYLESHNTEVVYLDPMYPERNKTTAAQVKKGMQILRSLPSCYKDNDALLQAALAAASHRVVVKRPTWAETITDLQPDTVVTMPNHHFDIYLL